MSERNSECEVGKPQREMANKQNGTVCSANTLTARRMFKNVSVFMLNLVLDGQRDHDQDRTNIVQIQKMQKHIYRCVSYVYLYFQPERQQCKNSMRII